MLHCPRCRQRIDPPAVSCAACGGIRGESLGGDASPPVESVLTAGEPVLVPREIPAYESQSITTVGEEPKFEEAIVAAEVVESPGELNLDFELQEKHHLQSTCSRCGSTKLIPNVKIVDQGEHANGNLRVVIYGDPQALIFKDAYYENLSADICGDCGHVELRVSNPRALYRKYLTAQ